MTLLGMVIVLLYLYERKRRRERVREGGRKREGEREREGGSEREGERGGERGREKGGMANCPSRLVCLPLTKRPASTYIFLILLGTIFLLVASCAA